MKCSPHVYSRTDTGGRLVAKARDTHGLASGGANQLPAAAAVRAFTPSPARPAARRPPAAELRPRRAVHRITYLRAVSAPRVPRAARRTPAMRTWLFILVRF